MSCKDADSINIISIFQTWASKEQVFGIQWHRISNPFYISSSFEFVNNIVGLFTNNLPIDL